MTKESSQNKELEKVHSEKKIWLVDISEEVRSVIHQLAEEATAHYLNSIQRERRGFWGVLMRYTVDAAQRGIIELSRNYIYHRFYRQIEEEIRNNYNIFQRIAIEGTRANIEIQDRERMSEFLRVAIERFEQNIADRFSRDIELGEGLRDEERNYLRNLTAQLIRDFIRDPQIDTPEGRIRFNQELSRRVQGAIQGGYLRSESFIGSGDTRKFDAPEFFVSNLYNYILNIKQEINSISKEHDLTNEQKKQIENYISSVSSLDIKLAQLTSSIRTKIPTGREGTPDYTLSAVERLCLRLENIPILNRIINPVTVGLAVSVGTREGLMRIGGRGLAAAAGATVLGSLGYLTAPILTGSVLAGIFAYYRGRARFKQDVGRILREQAVGLEITDPRAQSILERTALPGGENFRLNINDLIERLNNNDEEAYIQALSRLNIEYFTRNQVSNVPQLDLLISRGQWRSSWIERIQLERAVLDFENRNRERSQNLQERINTNTRNLLRQILEQDEIIMREARREGRIRGIITGISAVILGSTYQYLRDLIGETQFGERLSETFLGRFIAAPHAKERITLIEYLLGERPRAYQPGTIDINLGGKSILLDHILSKEQNITLPDGHIATFKLNEDGNSYVIELSEEAKRAGWNYDPETHKFIFTKSGISGTLVDNWNQLKEYLNKLGYKTEKARWIDFAYEKQPPKVISWNVPPDHPGFMSEGLELSMSFKPAENGDVIVKVPIEGTAFNARGGKWDLSKFFLDEKLILALSPRDRSLQHDPIIFEVKSENIRGSFAEVRIPKEVAEVFFIQNNGKVELNGAQITYNLIVGEDEKGFKLVSVESDYNPQKGLVNLPPERKEIPINIFINPPVPPTYLNPPIAIPIPLIDKTPIPGRYRETPTPIPQPLYYYNTSYFYTLEWLKRYTEMTPDQKDLDKKLDKNRPEDELLKIHINNLNKIEGEFSPDAWVRFYEINKIPEDKRSYKGFIEYLSRQIPPMKKENRVSIFIPARLEGKNIYRTLEEYTKQQDLQGNSLNPDFYEIVIFVNRKEGEERDNTLPEIERFKKNNPKYNIHVFDFVLPEDLAKIGFCRRVLTDIILYRAGQRKEKNGPLYLITEDADLEKVDTQIVARTIEKFEKYPNLDALKGIQLRNPEILSRCPHLWLERSVSDVTEVLSSHQRGFPRDWYYYSKWPDPFSWGRIITGGWCTAFKASTLVEIGGYDPKLRVGEDLFIGNTISLLRSKENDEQNNPKPNLETIKTIPVRHVSNARRFLSMLIRKWGGYERFGDSEVESFIRTLSPEQVISAINKYFEKSPKQKITEILNFNISRLFLVTRNLEESQRRSEILLQLFCLRKNKDYRWKREGIVKDGEIIPGEIELTDDGVRRALFLFEIFKYAIEALGVERVIRKKIGLWPIIAGFKSLPKEGEFKNKFEIIEGVKKLLGLSENIGEDEVVSRFLSLQEDQKRAMVENLFRQKYGG